MKYQDITNKDITELEIMLKEEQHMLGKLRFDMANQSVKNVSLIGKARKNIARILTAIHKIHYNKKPSLSA